MYEVKQAQVARAIDVLRAGPLTAAQFAVRMWPDRAAGRTPGQHSKMGHSFLRRLGELNYVSRIGDLWTVSVFDGRTAAESVAHGARNGHFNGRDVANGYPVGQPYDGRDVANGYPTGHPDGYPAGQTNGYPTGQPVAQVERQRLHRLVQQASEPVASVTHDAALGNLAVRAVAVDAAIVEACGLVVLLGRSANVYPPCGAPQMLVGLAPAEGARVLYLRWSQSGQPPELPRLGAWIRVPDGYVAMPGCWRPVGTSTSWMDPEDVRVRVHRQRAAAGLA